ncbi:hypothetical protein BH10PSE18_BH10PSE18_16070 [soil metagenome]
MYDAFLVTLRETAELLLIAGAMCAYLNRAGRPGMKRNVAAGMALGIGAAFCFTFLLPRAASIDPRWDPSFTVIAAIGVLIVALGMAASTQRIRTRIQLAMEGRLDKPGAGLFIVGLAALLALREGLEVLVFLRAFQARAGEGGILPGMACGLLAAGLCAVAWRSFGAQLRLPLVFRLSAVMLVFLSVELLVAGVTDLLRVQAAIDHRDALTEVVAPFARGGAWHLRLCLLLMVAPVLHIASGWWRETASSVSRPV